MAIHIATRDKECKDSIAIVLEMCLPGTEITFHDTGEKLISSIKKRRPSLIIIDGNLPDKESLELTRELRKISQAPILILSFLKNHNFVQKAIEAGADRCLNKPIRQLEFAAHVRALLRTNY